MKFLYCFNATALLIRLLQVLALSSLTFQVASQTYSCPSIDADPVVIPSGSSSASSISRSINKSPAGTVCLLARITPTPRNNVEDMNSVTITRTTNTADYNIIPVARSYDGHGWEKVAGPYVSDLQTSGCCSLTIPTKLPKMTNDSSKFKFVLMSFSHSLTSQEEVSRFFHQTTFGPTTSMIDSWDYGQDISTAMKAWVESQMDEAQTPVTAHREFFRKKMDAQAPWWSMARTKFFGPRFPCDAYSRWRDYLFDRNDWAKQFVKQGNIIMEFVDNKYYARGVVSEWKWEYNDQDLGTGFFTLCAFPGERIGAEPLRVNINGCKNVKGGNPALNLDGIAGAPLVAIDLPDRSAFGTIEPITNPNFYEPRNVLGGALYLKEALTNNAVCDSIPRNGDYSKTVGFMPDGSPLWYMNYIELDENTIENPIKDGGATVFGSSDRSLMLTWPDDLHCTSAAKTFMNIDGCYLSTHENACSSIFGENRLEKVKGYGYMDNNVICGSAGEVKNDPLTNNVFQYYGTSFTKMDQESLIQKTSAWTMIALKDGINDDQLRQRVAWALSQILVVTSKQINERAYTEIYVNYYDIFVRNAFGNYFNVLKEVAYSPMMAEMLSYLESKSMQFVLESEGTFAYPDENFAREMMQLFSMGVYMLNMDGTVQRDSNGSPIPSYDNTDIQNFARAWTGFSRQYSRANYEFLNEWNRNRIDPMRIYPRWRDPYPKMDLGNGFIGDKVPLCVDLPDKQFLKVGASYRLLGSTIKPDMHDQPQYYDNSYSVEDVKIVVLEEGSELKALLSANFDTVVTLTSELSCSGTNECDLDTLRIIQVSESPRIFYEYVRPPCVELAFFVGKKITTEYTALTGGTPMHYRESMCANEYLQVGMVGCCLDNSATPKRFAVSNCNYSMERTTFAWALKKCQRDIYTAGDMCDWTQVNSAWECREDLPDNWFWTDRNECNMKAKVNDDGMVAIVHDPTLLTGVDNYEYRIYPRVHPDTINYFKVVWENGLFPSPSNSCGNGVCESVYRACMCDLDITESAVFTSLPTSIDSILSQLHIGAVDPDILGSYNQESNTGSDIAVWHKFGVYSKDSIFRVKYRGKDIFLKNMVAMVKVDGSEYEFRNPPHYMGLAIRDQRDAYYETEYVLETYFHHPNVAPFLATRMIERFGVSNPSPRYIEAVATAFKDGMYEGIGDGNYGNLKAMVAAIVLDREARTPVLDSDPTFGSFREPLIKFIGFMRAMNFTPRKNGGEEVRLVDLLDAIGQQPHNAPSVFSFFLPQYSSPGHIKSASLTSPEAQVLTGPNVINVFNGLISLIDLGLQNCYGGMGFMAIYPNNCHLLESYYASTDDRHYGKLAYSPPDPNDAAGVVDNLSLLLTGGRLRLNSVSKSMIIDAYINAGGGNDGLRMAQKLFISLPEFHTTSVMHSTTNSRPEVEPPEPSGKRYKAVVFLFLQGGLDSFNVLVPYSGCSGTLSHEHYRSVRGQLHIPAGELLPIDASTSSQPCDTFGVHSNLKVVQSLYNDGDLLFIANMGVLQQYLNEDNFREKMDQTQLFAHNIQTEEVANVDIMKDQGGRGIGGRLIDAAIANGFDAGGVSVFGLPEVLVSNYGSLYTVDTQGLQTFNPMPWAQPLKEKVMRINRATSLGSGIYGETWSDLVYKSFGENDLLFDAVETATVETEFPDTPMGKQMEIISKLIKSRVERGNDRDVFYAEMPGFDTHGNLGMWLRERTAELNEALEAFISEIKDQQNVWDDVTIVVTSEFGRTLIGNTGNGSDHAWGGNYFVAGGEIDGKKILGEYPDDLSLDSELVVNPGIVIPTTPWDALWNGIAQWFGATTTKDLNEAVPNRNTFTEKLFSQSDIYEGDFTDPPTSPLTLEPTSSPVVPATPAPTAAKTSSPVTTPTPCADRTGLWIIDGTERSWCTWAAKTLTVSRCQNRDLYGDCPVTCDRCDPNTPAPVSSTPAPVVSTPAPIASTPAPEASTSAPTASTTPAPVTSTAAPVASTPAPVTSTAAPVASTPAPVAGPTSCADRTDAWTIGKKTKNWCYWARRGADAAEVTSRCDKRIIHSDCPVTCDACSSPTSNPATSSCHDSPLLFKFKGILQSCDWVAQKKKRCDKKDVNLMCRVSCDACDTTGDSNQKFQLMVTWSGTQRIETCAGLALKNHPKKWCEIEGVSETCRTFCSALY